MSVAEPVGGRAAEVEERILAETSALVACSTPSGEQPQTDRAIGICEAALPPGCRCSRPPCSTADCVADFEARLGGQGTGRILLLGHLDTVVADAEHQACRTEGDRVYGSGSEDMKGGVAIALAVMRDLAARPEGFAEIALLLVCDEEIRLSPFAHAERFRGYDACLCFEAGETTPAGLDGVIVERKGATTLRVAATGRAAHSGANPAAGRNALLALAKLSLMLAARSDPDGADAITVVPTICESGGVTNVVPARGVLTIDSRAKRTEAFMELLASVPEEIDEVRLDASLERIWPAMSSGAAADRLLVVAGDRLGRRIAPCRRGGASDASHFASAIPVCIDGLGPCGDGAHTPDEYILKSSVWPRFEIALALAETALAGS